MHKEPSKPDHDAENRSKPQLPSRSSTSTRRPARNPQDPPSALAHHVAHGSHSTGDLKKPAPSSERSSEARGGERKGSSHRVSRSRPEAGADVSGSPPAFNGHAGRGGAVQGLQAGGGRASKSAGDITSRRNGVVHAANGDVGPPGYDTYAKSVSEVYMYGFVLSAPSMKFIHDANN